jgi:hypothetical protein
MAWRHRARYRLLSARAASHAGDHAAAAEEGRAVSAAAGDRGDRRYQHRGALVASAAEARAGRALDPEALFGLVAGYLPLAGPDGWRDLAELAVATGFDEVWLEAEKMAAALVGQASTSAGLDGARVPEAVRAQLDAYRR